jgi:hypothetical protein
MILRRFLGLVGTGAAERTKILVSRGTSLRCKKFGRYRYLADIKQAAATHGDTRSGDIPEPAKKWHHMSGV